MNSQTLLINLSLGLLLGVVGQVVRAVAGLKKHSATAITTPATGAGEPFSWTQFGISLILGGVAGMLAVVVMWEKMNTLNKDIVLGLIASGYAGSDFLEGVIKWLPKTPAQ